MVPRRRMRSATSVAGRPGPGTQRRRMSCLEEQAHRLLDGGDGVAGGPVVAVQRAVQQPVPERGGVRVFAQDLGRVGGGGRVRDPAQHVVEGAAGQRGGVEVGLEDLGGLGGVEAGGVVAVAAGDGAVDGAGGERLRAAFGDHRVDTAVDRVPDQLRQPGGERRTGRAPHTAARRWSGR